MLRYFIKEFTCTFVLHIEDAVDIIEDNVRTN